MADGGGAERARGRVGTWDVRRPGGPAWPSGAAFGQAREILRGWLARDVAAGRLLPWIPIAFGFGVVLYFTADHEPALWAPLALTGGLVAAAVLARARAYAF